MKKVRILPCLDVKDGRVVKGVKFEGLRDEGDPVDLARNYRGQGAAELVILDISATTEGRASGLEVVRSVAKVFGGRLTVGGGVRSVGDVERLLGAGASAAAVATAAVERVELVSEIVAACGGDKLVVAIDAARFEGGDLENKGWEVVVRSGKVRTGLDVVAFAEDIVGRGAQEILLTSFDRDGTRSGYDLELLRAVVDAVGDDVAVIASGGAAAPEHLLEAIEAGAQGVLAASIFHAGDYTVSGLKDWLNERGVEVGE